MEHSKIKCILSADLLIILVIVNIFLTFIMFTKYKLDYKEDERNHSNKISVLEEKVAWTEDMIIKWGNERDKFFYKKLTKEI